jgi:16S rRNA (cytosine967-C5)-methyltransferase
VRNPPIAGVDVVLLDVPCTGTGTLRRHPDGRWRLGAHQVEELAAVQAEMLDRAQSLVVPGGLLMYSTCTLEPEENERQVKSFLQRHPDFEVVPTEAVPPRFLSDDGFLRVLPQESGFDGAFAARLRRVA